jgi:hypothetical protein
MRWCAVEELWKMRSLLLETDFAFLCCLNLSSLNISTCLDHFVVHEIGACDLAFAGMTRAFALPTIHK